MDEIVDTVPSTPVEVKPSKKHPVIELFGPVIQGEGSQAGQQTLFIRFGGCDYRCAKCDSLHAVIPEAVAKNATMMAPSEIAAKCLELKDETGVDWVTFSGGNPVMHKLDELVDLLTIFGFKINVETQGTLWQDWLYKVTVITVSPKSMGMGEKFEEDKYRRFIQKVNGFRPLCVKVVVFSQQDLEFALFIYELTESIALTKWQYAGPDIVAYYLSLGNPYPPRLDDECEPIIEEFHAGGSLASRLLFNYRTLSEDILCDRRLKPYRFLPQLHVLVYGNETGR